MTKAQIKHMVDRFLMWRLPENFSPDGGISFKETYNEHIVGGPQKHEPVGTNLFSADQATAMVRHMIEGMPGTVEKVHDGMRGIAPHGPVYHWRDGWMFCRGEAGDVHVWKTNDPNPPSVELTIPASEWASIVAGVCPQGDNAITHKAALGFHEYGNDPR